MQLITDIQNALDNYSMNDIPKDVSKMMLYSFGTACVIRTLTRGDIIAGVFSGAIAALASAIHAVVTPFFAKLPTNGVRLTWEQEMCRTSIAIIASGYVASIFGDLTVINNLFGMTILYGLYTHIEPSRGDLDRTAWFGFLPEAGY